jgi:hypothetical protein
MLWCFFIAWFNYFIFKKIFRIVYHSESSVATVEIFRKHKQSLNFSIVRISDKNEIVNDFCSHLKLGRFNRDLMSEKDNM